MYPPLLGLAPAISPRYLPQIRQRHPDLRRPFAGAAVVPCPNEAFTVAKTTPTEFIQQVRAETAKVIWPTRRETVMTGVMVLVMTTILALFFLVVDSFFEAIVHALLRLAQ